MWKSLSSRLSLACIGLLGLVGCAHEKSTTTCSSCQQNAAVLKANQDALANKKADSIPVWNVTQDPNGKKNSYVVVSTGDGKTNSSPAKVTTKEPASVTATTNDPKQSISMKPNPSPFNAVRTTTESDSNLVLNIPPQNLTVAPAPNPVAAVPQTQPIEQKRIEIGVNPNLKPGEKEIVRDNVPKTLAHAEDYTWIMGQLEYLHGKKTWRIRYVSFDKEDKFGGCFTLVGCEEKMSRFMHGDSVKIEGFVVDVESKSIATEYKVTDIVPLVTREVVGVKVEQGQ
jgi:hypothetical protein